MRTYEVLFVTEHGNGWAIVNSTTVSSVRSILENQSKFQPLNILHIKEVKAICGVNTSIIYEGHCETIVSPYDLAVSQGFEGSLEDWLESLKADCVQSDWNQEDDTQLDFIKNKPTLISTISNLTDTSISSPSNNQILIYNSTTQKWENKDIPDGAFVFTLTSDLNDTTSCDKTIEEIVNAVINNQDIYARLITDNGVIYSKSFYVVEGLIVVSFYFATIGFNGNITFTGHNADENDIWSLEEIFPGITVEEKQKLSGIEAGAEVNVQSDWNQSNSSADDYIKNKPTNIVTDASYVHTDNNYTTGEKEKLSGIEVGAQANVQTDWEETDDTDDAFLKNMPDVFRNLPLIADGTIIENIVQDYDGNWYNGVVMGNQIWLKESLRTTHDNEGNAITGSDMGTVYSSIGNWPSDYSEKLYSFEIATGNTSSSSNPSGVQGLSPTGWHIPSKAEFEQLYTYINNKGIYNYDNTENSFAKAISSKIGWYSRDYDGAPGKNQETNNITNLSFWPSGFAQYIEGFGLAYTSISGVSAAWTSTEDNNNDHYCGLVVDTSKWVGVGSVEAYFASVRCVCDLTTQQWFSANRDRLYLKCSSTGMVWSMLAEVAESGSYNDLTDKPTIPSTAADVNAIPTSEKGAASGVAELDANGKVPSSQLPSYVDDVLEYASSSSFPVTGESGKIYIALDTNQTYRWSGSAYVEISPSLALGETASTAYRGDRGKTAYDHSQVTDGSNPHNTTFANIASKPTTISGYGITDAFSGNYNDLTNKPTIPAAGIPSGGNAGQVLKKASATDYDVHWANASETLPSAYCTTSGSTAAKKANCSLYVTQTNQYLQVLIGSANTYQGALTLNINSAGAKPIYINGTVSSSSNYTLPNGTYFVFYDGTNYYFRTDGKLPMKDTAFGGSYNDLTDKPTIPAAQVNSDWNASSGVAQILNKPTIPSITLITWTNS